MNIKIFIQYTNNRVERVTAAAVTRFGDQKKAAQVTKCCDLQKLKTSNVIEKKFRETWIGIKAPTLALPMGLKTFYLKTAENILQHLTSIYLCLLFSEFHPACLSNRSESTLELLASVTLTDLRLCIPKRETSETRDLKYFLKVSFTQEKNKENFSFLWAYNTSNDWIRRVFCVWQVGNQFWDWTRYFFWLFKINCAPFTVLIILIYA